MRAIAALLYCIFFLPLSVGAQFFGEQPAQTNSSLALPYTVDMVIESNTSAPTFYQGRREPSAGSTVRAVAVVSDGPSSSGYRYVWRVGTQVQTSNEQAIRFGTPFDNPFLLRVDVFDGSNTKIASTQRYISLSEPSLVFYEDNLLRGMSETALPRDYTLVADEVSVRAEPYFTNSTYGTDGYAMVWRVNNSEVTGTGGDPHVITLRRNEGTGTYRINAVLNELGTFNSGISNTFSITF